MIYVSCLLIILISLLTLYPSLYIGLFGDDWLAIFRFAVHLSSPKEGWNFFSYFLTPYGSQDIIMGLLHQSFGNQAFFYEFTSLFLRMLAAFSLYPLIFYLTKNKLATFFAILFFGITAIGFDSTGWLLTMPTYLTIAFFNIFLYFYILFHDIERPKFLIISGIFFYLAYVTASARMIGAPLFILSLETFWAILDHTKKSLRYSLLRIASILIILIIISISGHSLGNSSDWFDRLNSGINTIQTLLTEGRTDFLLYPIIFIGGMFVPNFTLPNIEIITKKEMLFSVTLPTLTIFLVFLLVIKTNTSKLKALDISKSLIMGALWIFFVFVVRKLNLITFSGTSLILMLTNGGLAIIIWILLLLKYGTQKKILIALYISLSWTLASFFLTWVWAPGSYIDTTHRYLTTSAIGISIFFATIISLGKSHKNQFYLTLGLSVFLLLHIISTRTYIDQLLGSHNQQIVDTIWSSLPNIPQVGKKGLVFYFEKDKSNELILGDSVMFGFPFHIALLYNLTEDDKIPVPMTDWNEVVSAIKDGQSFKAYGYPLKPIRVDQVYAFRLEGKDHLIDITDTIRQKLVK